jgi:hypothetical protein
MPALPAHESDNKINNALGYGKDALTDNKCRAEGKERSHHKKEEELYDALDEMQPIAVKDGFVTFCGHFKNIGSFISFSLCDDYDVEKMCHHCHPIHGSSKECLELPPP